MVYLTTLCSMYLQLYSYARTKTLLKSLIHSFSRTTHIVSTFLYDLLGRLDMIELQNITRHLLL